jgi:DNA-binding IclR family transcriptional regulator
MPVSLTDDTARLLDAIPAGAWLTYLELGSIAATIGMSRASAAQRMRRLVDGDFVEERFRERRWEFRRAARPSKEPAP